jgi:hypothetical protein
VPPRDADRLAIPAPKYPIIDLRCDEGEPHMGGIVLNSTD